MKDKDLRETVKSLDTFDIDHNGITLATTISLLDKDHSNINTELANIRVRINTIENMVGKSLENCITPITINSALSNFQTRINKLEKSKEINVPRYNNQRVNKCGIIVNINYKQHIELKTRILSHCNLYNVVSDKPDHFVDDLVRCIRS